ncbi:malectin domain-containing carbohydrate-binding protein (plasmid) [Croceibacterium sp. TMG7-5b_MA50]|uniref:malectin domain-containing carbohydrate-binding protein n=1 Tax=Croceibacterium sp. TMG7-5b_MA50 TaxID=3121290 RepID=UPI00322189AD
MALLVRIAAFIAAALLAGVAHAEDSRPVEAQWHSVVLDDTAQEQPAAAYLSADTAEWQAVGVPHNWQGYHYNRQLRVGARHGVAWYRTALPIAAPAGDERIALRFEGVNSYATVWVNGREVGRHAGGLTGWEVDITDAVRGGENAVAVRVDHPAGITDLPWVSGDDQPENGFAEGSQPFGIFRPVHLVRSHAVRVRPHGAYAWGAPDAITRDAAQLTGRVELQNRTDRARNVEVELALVDKDGREVAATRFRETLAPGQELTADRPLPAIARPRLWSPADPYLHTLRVRLREGHTVIDESATPFGIRDVRIVSDEAGQRRLLVNGDPLFLRGVAEYEHLLGGSHAFAPEQVDARVAQARAAGFNAWRDAHYPHNLRYGQKLAEGGTMWWPQFSAHIWFDNQAFRDNFRTLLADWVRERRNNPAVFLWGLQNESRLPAPFAGEMVALIRELDPTASTSRLVVTCNGGEGADWNVPQNWSGTYGGDPTQFAAELAKQGLVGEFGGWRSLGLHDEAPHRAQPPTSEEHFTNLMHLKARLANSVGDRAIGYFHWLLGTHENPGRPMRGDGTQIWDGVRPLDHIGPANNKGLMTLWGEPTDAFYMYRALNVPASDAPMAYIVSHSWPDRWQQAGTYSGIEVYSNCPAVDLFNDAAGAVPLGRRERDADGRFVWNEVPVRYATLRADCVLDGKSAASDVITLHNLPPAPGVTPPPAPPAPDVRDPALYRVNAGGNRVVDPAGHVWQGDAIWDADRRWGWQSWAGEHPGLDPLLGSRRPVFDPVAGSDAPGLYTAIRYGRDRLQYRFSVPDGRYRVELHFVEPWYGRAGIDARGWRVFDVAVNGTTLIDDLDIFGEAGFNRALVRTVEADVTGGELRVHFPEVRAGQAVISAIAVTPVDRAVLPPVQSDGLPGSDLLRAFHGADAAVLDRFADNGAPAAPGLNWTTLPPALLDSEVIRPLRERDDMATLFPAVDVVLYQALTDGTVPDGWQATDLAAAMIDRRGTTTPVTFAMRRVAAGQRADVPFGRPTLIRRDLPSPYTPGNFTFARDRTLNEAEADGVERTGGAIDTRLRGHSGPGYVALADGAAGIGWTVETGAAGRRTATLRYQAEGARSGQLALVDDSGIAVATMLVSLTPGADWQELALQTPGFVNAGRYRLELRLDPGPATAIDSVRLE